MPYKGASQWTTVILCSAIIFCALLSTNKVLKYALLFALMFFQHTQIVHFTYFGGFYSQHNIQFMFSEMHDFLLGVMDLFKIIWDVVVITLCVYVTIFILAIKHEAVAIPWRSNFPALIVAFLLFAPLGKALQSKHDFRPSFNHHSVRNGLYSWNYFIAKAFKDYEGKQYKPYVLEKQNRSIDNLILILGESANPKRMSLFGSKTDTTPFLKSLSQSNKLHYQLAYSSSVATQYSLARFFSGVKEPDNPQQIASQQTNLFKLALDNGFETHYISNQRVNGISHSYNIKGIHTWIDRDMPMNTWGEYDIGLSKALLSNIKQLNSPQFAVMHMRNMHVIYSDNYPASFTKFKPASASSLDLLKSDYDNSLAYFDHTISTWIQQLQPKLHGRTLLVYIPDHGEKFGENGNGHNTLDLETATIPIFAYNLNDADEALELFKSKLSCITSHDQLHNSISELLGYKVHNPNGHLDKYYVSGLSLTGEAGWIEGSLHSTPCQS